LEDPAYYKQKYKNILAKTYYFIGLL
jgi:hypothetical protein